MKEEHERRAYNNLIHRVCSIEQGIDFSLGKGMLFGNFGQRNVKLR